MNKRNKNFKQHSLIFGVGLGLLVVYIVALSLLLLSTVFINYEYLDIISISVVGVLIALVAVTVGSVVASNIVVSKRNIAVVSVSGIYVLLNICISAVFFELTGRGVVSLLISAFAGAMSAIIVEKIGNNRAKKHYRNLRSG